MHSAVSFTSRDKQTDPEQKSDVPHRPCVYSGPEHRTLCKTSEWGSVRVSGYGRSLESGISETDVPLAASHPVQLLCSLSNTATAAAAIQTPNPTQAIWTTMV